jgi:hypothetical protein
MKGLGKVALQRKLPSLEIVYLFCNGYRGRATTRVQETDSKDLIHSKDLISQTARVKLPVLNCHPGKHDSCSWEGKRFI